MNLVQTSRPQRRNERGFTLIELMIAVAIIGVLAAVVVPSWMRESRKTKADTEINGMFAELAIKEEQHKIEHHVYLAAPQCPTLPSAKGADFAATCVTGGSAWAALRIAPPAKTLACTYEITVGRMTDVPSPPAGFTMDAPATSWWFVVAECDMDGQSATNSTFFQSSVDTKIQRQNYGS